MRIQTLALACTLLSLGACGPVGLSELFRSDPDDPSVTIDSDATAFFEVPRAGRIPLSLQVNRSNTDGAADLVVLVDRDFDTTTTADQIELFVQASVPTGIPLSFEIPAVGMFGAPLPDADYLIINRVRIPSEGLEAVRTGPQIQIYNGTTANAVAGEGDDEIHGVLTLPGGNLGNPATLLCGQFAAGIDLFGSSGMLATDNDADVDGFLAALDVADNLLWLVSIDGLGEVQVLDIDWDPATGNVFVSGIADEPTQSLEFGSQNGPDTIVNFPTSQNQDRNGFLACYSGGGQYLWSETFTGNGDQFPRDVTFLPNNTVAVVGSFQRQIEFGSTTTELDPMDGGPNDRLFGFLVGYNAAGEQIWVDALIGDSSSDHAIVDSCAASTDRGLLAVGTFEDGAEFLNSGPPTINSGSQYPLSAADDDADIWVAKFAENPALVDEAPTLMWVFREGGNGVEDAPEIRCAVQGDQFFLSGSFDRAFTLGVDLPAGGTQFLLTGNGDLSAFVATYDATPRLVQARDLECDNDARISGLKATDEGGVQFGLNWTGEVQFELADFSLPNLFFGGPAVLNATSSNVDGAFIVLDSGLLGIRLATISSSGDTRVRDTARLPDGRYRFGGGYAGSSPIFTGISTDSTPPTIGIRDLDFLDGGNGGEEYVLGDLNPDGSF